MAIRNVDDLSLLGRQIILQEGAEIPLADETDARGIFFAGNRIQLQLLCDRAHLRLGEIADRKQRMAKRLFPHLTEKIRLILVLIHAAQQPAGACLIKKLSTGTVPVDNFLLIQAGDIRRAEQVFAAAQQTMEDMYLSAKNIKM